VLTYYGDLDVSVIDELPPNRKPVKTFWVSEKRRSSVYEAVKRELDEGRQAYVVALSLRSQNPSRQRQLPASMKNCAVLS